MAQYHSSGQDHLGFSVLLATCKVEKGQKPPLRYDARCIHESIRDYLNVYEAKRAKPWTQKGKRFICGFTKEFMMNTAEKGTRWITCGGRRARDKAIRDA